MLHSAYIDTFDFIKKIYLVREALYLSFQIQQFPSNMATSPVYTCQPLLIVAYKASYQDALLGLLYAHLVCENSEGYEMHPDPLQASTGH